MYSSSSAVLLLYTPQKLKTVGLTLIGVLISLTGGQGPGVMIFFIDACKGGLYRLLQQGLLMQLQATLNSSCCYINFTVI
jgi:hypothetical protein